MGFLGIDVSKCNLLRLLFLAVPFEEGSGLLPFHETP